MFVLVCLHSRICIRATKEYAHAYAYAYANAYANAYTQIQKLQQLQNMNYGIYINIRITLRVFLFSKCLQMFEIVLACLVYFV